LCFNRSQNAVPEKYIEEAHIKDIPYARFWGDEVPDHLMERLSEARDQAKQHGMDTELEDINSLAISGGGANGAFGAGLLVGWAAAGNRPVFHIVTGVSTGALIAPFAFLGSDYDALLKKVFTTSSTKDIIKKRRLFPFILGSAVTDSSPLRNLLLETFDDKMIIAIANEHKKGRRLHIGTTNLDADRPVVWDIGVIAASGKQYSAELICDIILASASVPGVFPPVFIEVETGDETYDEMHVDGGTSSQVFLNSTAVDVRHPFFGDSDTGSGNWRPL